MLAIIMNIKALLIIIVIPLVTGCGAVTLSPVASEEHVVTPVDEHSKSVTLMESMVWYDRAANPTRGIRFPQGSYIIEAEDAEYYYYKSPEPIEYRVLKNGSVVSGRELPGGFFLGKALLRMVPAGAYLSASETQKTVTWKLGGDFLAMEGKRWKKNY